MKLSVLDQDLKNLQSYSDSAEGNQRHPFLPHTLLPLVSLFFKKFFMWFSLRLRFLPIIRLGVFLHYLVESYVGFKNHKK